MSKSREQIRTWTKKIDVTGKTVLDVGSGSPKCWVIHWLKGKPKLFRTLDIVQKTSIQYPGLKIDYIRDLNKPILDLPKFDYVFALEVLEHIWNPLMALENLSRFTKEKLFISVPFFNPMHDEHDYLRYTMQWFEKVLPMYGFNKIEIIPRVATIGREAMREFLTKEGLRMSKITYALGYGEHYYDIGYCIEAVK